MFISVTRLRIRSIRFLPMFFITARRTGKQAQRANGFMDGALLVDRKLTFWTMTAWTDDRAMIAYRNSGIHHSVMPRLFNWCDEAAVVHWNSDGEQLPSWDEAHAKLASDGSMTKLPRPSANHVARIFPSPRVTLSQKLAAIRAES